MKNLYRVHGQVVVDIYVDVIAKDEEEAVRIAQDEESECIEDEWNGNSVFFRSYEREGTVERGGNEIHFGEEYIELIDSDVEDDDEDEEEEEDDE